MTFAAYDCRAITKAALMTPTRIGWGLPFNWIGDIGGGKTSIITDVIKYECGLLDIVVPLGPRQPHDILGLGIPQDDGYMRHFAPDFVKRANEAYGAVIYADEGNYASPAVQGAFQRAVQEGYCGDEQLGEGVRFLMSMNPIDQATGAGGNDISIALANRVGHREWIEPTVAQWSTWLLGDDTTSGMGAAEKQRASAKDLEKMVLKAWSKEWAKARALVTTFLQRKPDLLKRVPKMGTPQASGAFPTPRSWENSARALASANVHQLDVESKFAFMGAFVGDEPVGEFQNFIDKFDLPDPEEVLDGKVTFKHDPRRLDLTMAVLAACAAIVTPESCPNRVDRAKKFWEVIADTAKEAPDVAVSPVRSVSSAPGRLGAVSKTARKVMSSMHGAIMIQRMI